MADRSQDPKNPFQGFRIDLDAQKVDEALAKVRERLESARDRVGEGVSQARHTKVRLSYKGRQLGPDIPLSAFLAGEGVAFAAMGPLYALLTNVGARAVLDVEFVHDADELVALGREAFAEGEVEAAEKHYRDALERRKDDPSALYHLGVLLRVTGRQDEATRAFRKAAMGPEGHPDVVRAAEMIERMAGRRTL
ncbi:MAG: tetratricopeptide repeat protein [Alphaproteobacteria bacterium]|nr:tetratricopeptide repeat protein [Alphaproteobacteria bacterium]